MATTSLPPLIRLGTRPGIGEYLRSLWVRRGFALAIPRAELQAQHRNSVLGGVWHILDPLFLIAVYYLIFGVMLPDVTRGRWTNVVGFLAIGVFMWQFTSKSAKAGGKSVVNNESLVRAIAFPRAILPLAAVLAELAAFGVGVLVMYATALATGETLSWTWLMVVPLVLIQFMWNLGLGFTFARIAHHFRDILQVLPYTLRVIGYASGVIIPIEDRLAELPTLRFILMDYNPAFILLNIARLAILDNTVAPARDWMILSAWAVGTLLIGFLFFLRREHEYGRG
ncbi:MAG TPA: ABC transporter permease [Egibacteraceae bacterium]|nr:ABC transporter permease [Egibacteraceae bacterium]